MANVRVGISGWVYPKWRGTFYPAGLAQRYELSYAAERLNAIEINGTFYSLKKPADFLAWREQTPRDFLFAVKGPRFITHMKKLKDVEQATANFFASGILRLNARLGPILWQFPAQMPYMADRFEAFCALLPKDTREAARLATRHNDKLKDVPWLRIDKNRPLRHAFEVRHPSFLGSEFLSLLRRHGFALVFADSAGKFCYAEDITADFIYIRLHGSTQLYASGYTDLELRGWADKIARWRRGELPCGAPGRTRASSRRQLSRDVYVFFDNDAKVHAPFDAQRLAALLRSG